MKKPAHKIYRTTNWPAYNRALMSRGNIAIWFDPATQWYAPSIGKQGRNQTYSDAAIQCCLMITQNHDLIEEFRKLFGDERQDYSEALKKHYNEGPPKDWQSKFVSSYASTHPWEDWAESWAHYLHMMDTLETAYHAGLVVKTNKDDLNNMEIFEDPIGAKDFEKVLQNWMTITFNLNALNRSMGLEDAYPFTLSIPVLDKFRFIHQILIDYQNQLTNNL